LFFTKICIAVQPMERARSIDMAHPPEVETWEPRRGAGLGIEMSA